MKTLRIFFVVIVFLLSVLLKGPFHRILALTPPPTTPAVDSFSMSPAGGNFALDQTFSVTVGVNVGSDLHVNVMRFQLSASNATIAQCTVSNGFQGVAGQSPCTKSNASAAIVATAVSTLGPSGMVPLATLTLKGNATGSARLLSSIPEIVVSQSDGRSTPFNVTSIDTGNYQIGFVSLTPSPTPPSCDVALPKSQGNANDDCTVDDGDFAFWLDEYSGIDATTFADFDGDGKVNLVDYEIWRRNASR